MKRKIFVGVTFFIGVVIVVYYQQRTFLNFTDATSITILQRTNSYYLIYGKYYGVTIPDSGFIQTKENTILSLYKLKGNRNIYIKDEELGKYDGFSYVTSNAVNFIEYRGNHETFYTKNSKSKNDVKDEACFLVIDLNDNHYRNERGQVLN